MVDEVPHTKKDIISTCNYSKCTDFISVWKISVLIQSHMIQFKSKTFFFKSYIPHFSITFTSTFLPKNVIVIEKLNIKKDSNECHKFSDDYS